MEKERRMIVWQDGTYQILKPKNEHGWQGYGEKKSLKAIVNLVDSEKFNLTYSDAIAFEVETYKKRREKTRLKYLREKGLASKTF